jgi:hypothetical protein
MLIFFRKMKLNPIEERERDCQIVSTFICIKKCYIGKKFIQTGFENFLSTHL